MPRTAFTSQTEFYRLLIESFHDGQWHEQYAYGPYTSIAPAKASMTGGESYCKDRYEKGTRRSRIQKQVAVMVKVPGLDDVWVPHIEWHDVA